MKYWRGYVTAAIFAAMTWALSQLGQKYSNLVDMVYPYITRSVQGFLTAWSSGLDICVWQVAVIAFVAVALAALVVMIIFKRSIIQWLGWVAAAVSLVILLNTGIYGLNFYAGPIEQDLRMEMSDYTQSELEQATEFYRDKANALSVQLPRDSQGNATFSSFEELAELTGNGYRHLVLERSFSIFGGDYTPVKKLGFADLFTSAGMTGLTCYLTGEAAVNPQIPAVSMPFTMAHEMAHRLCIPTEDAANFSAFLSCEASDSLEYRYSAYFMAYRYCYNALASVDSAAARRISEGCVNELRWDIDSYDRFFAEHKDQKATDISHKVNDTYIKASGDPNGIAAYGAVCDYLVNWYLLEYATPEEVEIKFDPYDETQVDLSGLANAKPVETEPAETEGEE